MDTRIYFIILVTDRSGIMKRLCLNRSGLAKKVLKHDIMRQVKRMSNTRDQNQYKCKDGDVAFGSKLLINNISYTSLCNLIRRNKLTRYLSVPHKLLPAIDFSIIFFAPAEPSSVAALFIVVCCRFCNLQKSGGRAGFTGVWWG